MTNKKKSPKIIKMFSLKNFLLAKSIKRANKLTHRQEKRNAKLLAAQKTKPLEVVDETFVINEPELLPQENLTTELIRS